MTQILKPQVLPGVSMLHAPVRVRVRVRVLKQHYLKCLPLNVHVDSFKRTPMTIVMVLVLVTWVAVVLMGMLVMLGRMLVLCLWLVLLLVR